MPNQSYVIPTCASKVGSSNQLKQLGMEKFVLYVEICERIVALISHALDSTSPVAMQVGGVGRGALAPGFPGPYMLHSQWSMVHSPWSIVHGPWSTVHSPLYLDP